jgi:hypothetical protein
MRKIIITIITLLLLNACTAAPTATMTPTSTSTNTPESEPTATITPTATPDSNAIADSLALRSQPGYESRTFVIEGDYLIDQWNNVPKAVKTEDGSWRKLDYTNPEDAMTMYGAMTPIGGGHYEKGAYIDYGAGHEGLEVQTGMRSVLIAPIFTGDWEVKQVGGSDSYELISTLRDGNGTLQAVELAWYLLGTDPAPTPVIWCFTPESGNDFLRPGPVGNYELAAYTPDAAPLALRPGSPVGVLVYANTSALKEVGLKNPYLLIDGVNNQQRVTMTKLLKANPGSYTLSTTEYEAMRDRGEWPNRLVTLAMTYGPAVSGVSLSSCVTSLGGAIATRTNNDR